MQKNYILFAVFSLLHSSVCLFFLTLCRYVFLASSLSPRPDLCCCSFISCIMLSTGELCSEWNSYFIFFSLLLLVCLILQHSQEKKFTFERALLHVRSLLLFFFLTMHSTLLPSFLASSTMMAWRRRRWWWWLQFCGAKRERGIKQKGQHKRFGQYSPLLLPSCMHTGWRKKRRNEIELSCSWKTQNITFSFL